MHDALCILILILAVIVLGDAMGLHEGYAMWCCDSTVITLVSHVSGKEFAQI